MKRQTGSVLITVTMTLILVGAIVYLLGQQGAALSNQVATLDDRNRARFLAEAGLSHAIFAAKEAARSSKPYPATVNGMLNGFSYHAVITSDPKYPGTIQVVSTGQGQRATFSYSKPYLVGCTKQEQTMTVVQYSNDRSPKMLSEAGGNAPSGYLHPSDAAGQRRRALFDFDLSAVPKEAQIVLALLILDVRQHDKALEGGNLIVNRVTTAYSGQSMTWTKATNTTNWNVPEGDYSVGDIAVPVQASAITYQLDMTSIVNGWVRQPPEFSKHGLILRTDKAASSGGKEEFRLETNTGSTNTKWPRLRITYCA